LLFIAVLCCIPAISPLMPIAAVMPVVFVLTISLLREGAEDYARYKSDEDMNNKVSSSKKKKCCRKHVCVYDTCVAYRDVLDGSHELSVCLPTQALLLSYLKLCRN
jgi:hypothetical protein